MIVAVLAMLLASGAQAAATYSWRGADLIAGRTSGPVVTATTFDAARRPITSSSVSAGRLRFGEQVAWAPRGLRDSVARTDQNRAGLSFSYDGAARLTSAERVAGTQTRAFRDLPGRFGFGYDHADNLLSQQSELECATDALGTPLDGSGRNRPGSVGGVALSWNRAGQLADRGILHFGYDASGRLISTKVGNDPRPEGGADAPGWAEMASYSVDVLGRRVLERRGTETVERVWSGWQEIERYDTEGSLEERRTYGLGLDEVISLELRVAGDLEAFTPIYGSSGHLSMLVRTSTGVPVEAYEYSPYGARSVYVNDLAGPAIEQIRVRPEVIWIELSEEVRLEDLDQAITLENLTLGGQELPVELSQPVLDGRNAGRRVAVWANLPDTAPEGQPTWPPRLGEQIRLVIGASGLVDVWGNVASVGEERTWQWAGGDVSLADTAAPRVLRVCVSVDGRIEIELSEQPDQATLGAISVDGQAVAWTISTTGYLLTSAHFAAGSRALVIGTALEDLAGTPLAEQWSGSVDIVEGEPSLAWAAPWPGAVAGSSVGNQLGFHGLPHDPVTGLVYARNRDYDPEMGRFIQTDPLGYVDSVSLYQYGLNNPVNFSDPTGEFAIALPAVPFLLKAAGWGLAAYAVGSSSVSRFDQLADRGSSGEFGLLAGQSLALGLSDILGTTRIYEAARGREILTGEHLGLGQRALRGGLGTMQAGLTLVGGAALGGRAGAIPARLSPISRAARWALRKPLERVGGMTSLPLGSRLTVSVRASRMFATATRHYAGLRSAPVGRLLRRTPLVRQMRWQQGHLSFQQRFWSASSATRWYPGNPLAELGLRRLGNAGINLAPLPRALNIWLARHPWASFGVGLAAGGSIPATLGGSYEAAHAPPPPPGGAEHFSRRGLRSQHFEDVHGLPTGLGRGWCRWPRRLELTVRSLAWLCPTVTSRVAARAPRG